MRLGLSQIEIFDILRAHFEAKGFVIPAPTETFTPFLVIPGREDLNIDINNIEFIGIKERVLPVDGSKKSLIETLNDDDRHIPATKFIPPDRMNAQIIRELNDLKKQRNESRRTREVEDNTLDTDILGNDD